MPSRSNTCCGRPRTSAAELARRAKTARGAVSLLPLPQLAHSFHLTEFETQALVICLGHQINARYEKLYAYLQNDFSKKAPSVDLILGLLSRTVEERIELLPFFDATAPLLHYRLIESVENGTGLSAGQRFFRADLQILQYVLGNQAFGLAGSAVYVRDVAAGLGGGRSLR